MYFALGFYEALLELLNSTDEEVCLDVQFHFEAFSIFMTILSTL